MEWVVSNLRTTTMSAFYFTDSALCSQTDLILKAQLVICSHTHVRGKTNMWISAQSIMRIFFLEETTGGEERAPVLKEACRRRKWCHVKDDIYVLQSLETTIHSQLSSFFSLYSLSVYSLFQPLSLEHFVSLPVYERFVFDALFNRS